MNTPVHVPILTEVLLEHLQLRPGDRCIDATVDGGGHTAAMLARTAPDGCVLGIDRDPELLSGLRRRLASEIDGGRLRLACGSFRQLAEIAAAHEFAALRAVIFDVGVSSYHFDLSGRGFSFQRDEPLDMRFDPTDRSSESAADLLNSRDVEELETIFGGWGEERFSGRIARAVARARPLQTTSQLLEVITRALPGNVRWQAARSAARIFQALRIAVNDELDAIAAALPQALDLLAPQGRLAVLSFHSLEDRIVKQFFVAERQAGRVRILTKKPIRAGDEEIAANPRAGSAKLRVCERLA